MTPGIVNNCTFINFIFEGEDCFSIEIEVSISSDICTYDYNNNLHIYNYVRTHDIIYTRVHINTGLLFTIARKYRSYWLGKSSASID